jgi:hypothetical protein
MEGLSSISTSSHTCVAAPQVGVTREKRIQYARELLEKNFLPHVSISPGCQTLKVRTGGAATGALVRRALQHSSG